MFKGNNLVSVIVPCYNARKSIGETIMSVASQDFVSLEIIVVDDGSDDETVAVASSAAASATTYLTIIRQPHLGVSSARNAGTKAARGRYILYLDGDDMLEVGTIAERISALQESLADVAYCDWRVLERQAAGSYGDGPITRRVLGNRPDIELLTDAWWPPGALLYRREIIDRIGQWNERLSINQDAEFLIRAALVGAMFVRAPHVGLRYRIQGCASLSRNNPDGLLLDSYATATSLHLKWQQEGTLDRARSDCLHRIYTHLARVYFGVDDRISADVKYWITALGSDIATGRF